MNTYQNYRVDELEIASLEKSKLLCVMFTTIFLTAVFIVPTVGAIKLLFF